MGKGTRKDVARIIKRLKSQGYKVRQTKKSHICVTTPQGPVICSSTPSDKRAIQNMVTMFRRKGVKVF